MRSARTTPFPQTHSRSTPLTAAQIKYEELSSFSEIIAAGTAAALVPIKSITRRSRDDVFPYIAEASDEPGPVFTKLLTTLQDIQRGKAADPYGWCEVVQQPEAGKYQ